MTVDDDVFGVHTVTGNLHALYRLEGSGTDMQCQLVALDAVCIDVGKYSVGEMQSGCRRSDGAFNL